MAAAFLKNGLLNTQRDRRFLHHLYRRTLKYSTPDSVSAQNNIRSPLQPFYRITHSIFRRTEFSTPIKTPSRFSTRASSSSQKFGFVNWYLSALKTRPISTKSITAAFIYTAADISSQTIVVENLEQYDLIRILRMAGYGMVILGPSVHYWYTFMSRVFPKRDLLSTFKKMALGQALFGPAMTVIFFSVNAALQGESSCEIVARLKRDLLPTLINGIMYWPVCDFVTFKFIPVHLQPLVINSFSYIWTVYMTYMASLTKVGIAKKKKQKLARVEGFIGHFTRHNPNEFPCCLWPKAGARGLRIPHSLSRDL